MRTLEEIMAMWPNSDKNSLHSYGPIYERLFAPYRDTALDVGEVGVRDGSSLRGWAEYFTRADVWGFDNGSEAGLPVFTEEEQRRITMIVADTTKPSDFLKALPRRHLMFDVIIDDGLHHPYGQVATWAMLSPFLRSGGLYLIEDIEDISFAQTMQRLFGGKVYDLREVKGRHDDIVLAWEKPK